MRRNACAGLFGCAAANGFLHLPHMRLYRCPIGFGLWDAQTQRGGVLCMVKQVGCMQKCFGWITAIIKTRTAKFIALNQRDTLTHTCRDRGRGAARPSCADDDQVICRFPAMSSSKHDLSCSRQKMCIRLLMHRLSRNPNDHFSTSCRHCEKISTL